LQGQTNASTTVYQLRGVANGDVLGDATVASYLDDFAFSVPTTPWAAPADLYDINRIEVLQGPQGTLYGSSSLGGVVKVVTNDPVLGQYHFSAAASGASVYQHGYNYSGDVMVNVPIGDDFAIRAVVSAKHLSGDATAPALGIQNANNEDVADGRVKLLYRPNDRLQIVASYWHFEDNQDFTDRVDHSNPAAINDTGVGNSPSHFSLGTLRVSYDLGFATLTSASGYLSRGDSLLAVGCQALNACFNVKESDTTQSYSEELRLTSSGSGPLHWIGGFFYQHGSDGGPDFFNLTNPNIAIVSSGEVYSTEYAGFGEASYDLFGGMLRPLIGLRYSAISRSLTQDSMTTVEVTPPVVQSSTAGASGQFFHVNPRFNLSFYPTQQGMFYVNVAEGFRPGALQTSAAVASLQAVLGVVTPVKLNTDSLWSYEVGTKWKLFDDSVNVALTLYAIDWKNAQFQTGASGISGMINLGNVTGKGVELTVSQRTPIPGLSWQLAGGWNTTTINDMPATVTSALPYLHNGMQVPPVPRGSAALNVNYERPIGYEDMDFVSDFNYQYRDHEEDLSTGFQSATLNIIGADIGVRRKTYEILFFADNITDDKGPSIWEEGRMIIPRPRTIGIRLAWTPE
jgi:outer membrane receptor protein involved in Fe transport